ncbi:uncharacterized protein [Physcomitrium patens]|uniref:Uncharacterized protein n=1 Tax=Physcomitrium patens TaxID=3218 RepID=A0A7I4D085_PHYPA
MAGNQVPEPKPCGQHSIPSMFTNPRILGGRSGNGRSLPLMDFLNRKSEKRASLQGCVVDAGLTPEVIERSNKHFENREDCHGIGKDLDTSRQGKDISECRTSNRELVSSTSKPWRRAQAFAEPSNGKLNECLEDSTVISHAPDRSTGQVHISLKLEIFNSRSSSSTAVEARCDYEFLEQNSDRLIQSNDTHQFQCRSMNFIDLTEDEDPALQRLGGKNHSHENTETQRKRKRSHAVAAEEAMARCPVCNDLFPPHVLQAHVESELDSLEMLGTSSEPEAYEAPGFHVRRNESQENKQEDGSTWDRHDIASECSTLFKESNFKSRPKRSLLVLGDEPKNRKPTFPRESKKPNTTFNHYADGAGWFDEGGVGVDVEAVGSACIWEGLGSMSFGGTL